MLDILLEIFLMIFLLLLGVVIQYKVLPVFNENPKKDNPFYNRVIFVQVIVLMRLLYLIFIYIKH